MHDDRGNQTEVNNALPLYTRRSAVGALCALGLSAIALPACSKDYVPWDSSPDLNIKGDTTITTDKGWKLQKEGTLKVAAALNYMPFEGESGFREAGFSYELMQKVADRLGLQLEYVSLRSQERVVAAVLEGAKADMGVSSLETTMDGMDQLLVSAPYLLLHAAISTIRESGFSTMESLAGRKVGVVPGSVSATWAKTKLPDSEFVEYQDWTFLFAAVQACNVDAVASSLEVAWYQLRIKMTNASVIYSEDSSEQFVAALAPGNEVLRDAINAALRELEVDGSRQQLYDSWFHETVVNPDAVPSITPEQGAPGYVKGA